MRDNPKITNQEYERDLSAQKKEEKQNPWISRTLQNRRWKAGFEIAPRQGQKKTLGLIFC